MSAAYCLLGQLEIPGLTTINTLQLHSRRPQLCGQQMHAAVLHLWAGKALRTARCREMLMFSCKHSGVGGFTCWCMRRMVTGFSAAARASTELYIRRHMASVTGLPLLASTSNPDKHTFQLSRCFCTVPSLCLMDFTAHKRQVQAT